MSEVLRRAVIDSLDLSVELSDSELLERIDRVIASSDTLHDLPVRERVKLRKNAFDSFRRMDVLQELIEDEDVSEIMVNGPNAIFYEKGGRISRFEGTFDSKEKLEDMIQQIVSKVNRVVNTSSPIVDARLADGSRVNVVLPPAALNGPILTIRRFPAHPIDMDMLLRLGSLTEETSLFLKQAVESGYNIFISGGTGSGKTTFLNVLSSFIPSDERVITIEDSAELQLPIENLVRLEARSANAEGQGRISIRDLIRTALRMRPDRIVVGEVRGGEALDMLQAMNTGHDGSLSTGHGNSPEQMIHRLETMILETALPLPAIRGQIGSALDLMVHLGRLRDGSRKVLSVTEVLGYEDGEIRIRELYGYDPEKGLRKVAELTNREKWRGDGLS